MPTAAAAFARSRADGPEGFVGLGVGFGVGLGEGFGAGLVGFEEPPLEGGACWPVEGEEGC